MRKNPGKTKRAAAAILAAISASALTACSVLGGSASDVAESAVAQRTSEASSADTNLDRLLKGAIAEVEREYDVRAGVAVADARDVAQVGLSGEEPTWSTVKVPIAIAALRAGASTDLVDLAIKQSDNAAAWALWSQVAWTKGNAADEVEALLEHYGSQGRFEEAFGYSTWLLEDQAVFGAHLPCIPEAEYVYEAMGDIVKWQHNGLDSLPHTRAKGGWGLSELDGQYTHRQFGVRTTDNGAIGLAIEVTMPGQQMAEAIPALNLLAARVDSAVTQALDAGVLTPLEECPRGEEKGEASASKSSETTHATSSARRFGS